MLILTLSEKGMLFCANKDYPEVLDSFVDNLKDPVGAGDALLAYASLALGTGAHPVIGSILGSIAAAGECEQEGNIPISQSDMIEKLKTVYNHLHFRKVDKKFLSRKILLQSY